MTVIVPGSRNKDEARFKKDAPWGEPQRIEVINSSGADQCPALSLDEHRLYFASNRPEGSCGSSDIWVTERRDRREDSGESGWRAPANLGCELNSTAADYSPNLFEDENGNVIMYFGTMRTGTEDIYMSVMRGDDTFGPAEPVAELCTSSNERGATIRRDGLEVIFDSDRAGGLGGFDIYRATRTSTADPWSEPVNLTSLNSNVSDGGKMSLSFDGTQLYFRSNRLGHMDLYVADAREVAPVNDWARQQISPHKEESMNILWRTITAAVLVAAYSVSGFGQTAEQPATLVIEIDNAVLYRDNTTDVSRIAKTATPTTSTNISFRPGINVADIVSVNGKPAKGTFSNTFVAMPYRMNPNPGQPIADANGTATFHCTWHVLAPDGTYVGTINDAGSGPSPGHGVVAGTGAFFGVTGLHRDGEMITATRAASTEEDPANRRINGGGKTRYVFYLYPRYRPTVETAASGPAIFHADFSPVTAAKPARAGEILIAAARNLGPTRPEFLPPGTRSFKSDPLEVVNSPVEVTVNGRDADVINKVGWPGTSDLYRVDFRVPEGLAPGMVALQLTAAWIPGPEVKIPVQ